MFQLRAIHLFKAQLVPFRVSQPSLGFFGPGYLIPSQPQTLTMTNLPRRGTSRIEQIWVYGEAAGDIKIQTDSCSATELQSNQGCQIKLACAAEHSGLSQAKLAIRFSGSREGAIGIPLSCYSPSPPNGIGCAGKPPTIIGTDSDDVIVGLGGNDLICGGLADDHMMGGQGDDLLEGGDGSDKAQGGQGKDVCIKDSSDASRYCESTIEAPDLYPYFGPISPPKS